MRNAFVIKSLLLFCGLFGATAFADSTTPYPLTPSYVDILIQGPNGKGHKVTLSGYSYDGRTKDVAKATVIHSDLQNKSVSSFELTMSYVGRSPNFIPIIEINVSGQYVSDREFFQPGENGGVWTSMPAFEGSFKSFGRKKYIVKVEKIYDREMLKDLRPNSKTFRTTEAQAYCYGVGNSAECVADFNKGDRWNIQRDE